MNQTLDFDLSFEGVLVESTEDKGTVLKDVLLCGLVSRNGYKIPATAFKGDKNLYLKKPIYLDHPSDSKKALQRSVRDLAGEVVATRYDEQGRPRGDILAYPTESGRLLRFLAETKAAGVGMSHVAMCKKTQESIDEVVEVISVDVVTRPATTNGFTEQTQAKEPNVVDETTVKELRQERDDARQKIGALESQLSEIKTKLASLESENTALKADKQGLEVKVEQYQAAEALSKRASEILSEAKAAGINTEDAVIFSEAFNTQLMGIADAGQRKALLADRAALTKQAAPVQKPRGTGAPAAFDPAKGLESILNG